MMHHRRLALFFAVVLSGTLAAAEADAVFDQSIRPILNTYCLKCHSSEKHKGDLDLQRFTTLNDAKKQPKVWLGVAEQLALGEMPPPKETQLPAAERERLTNWVRATLDDIALAHAGDPGPVALRHLSNAEYTYTIRDLTGVDTLDPVREFPVDGAAGEGFTNTGQALVMSPSLLAKYFDAGKDVASHAVLLPDGIAFSAKTTRRDRTEEILARIREFYRQFTDPGGGAKVNLQGIVFETNAGGLLPLEKYLVATIAEREALIDGRKTTDAVAQERGLNAKYLATLFKTLTDKKPSLVLDAIREHWRTAKPGEAAALVAEIGEWQKALWKFSSVGHIGKLNGPKAWMEPIDPLETQHTARIKLPDAKDGKDITLYLVASNAGGENAADFVVWREPKLTKKGAPSILLKDVKGIDPALFGKHPNGKPRDPNCICAAAPSVIEIALPAAIARGYDFETTGVLDNDSLAGGCIQLQVLTTKPSPVTNTVTKLRPGGARQDQANGPWTSNNHKTAFAAPIIVAASSPMRAKFAAAFDDFRKVFPAALCYAKIVPVDEVVTLTLFYREDNQLAELMLDTEQKERLDRMWDELHYVSHDALTLVDAFEQIWQFATQDADPKVFEPLREPIKQHAAAFRQLLLDTEPKHVDAVLEFAGRAYRRTLTDSEKSALRALYRKLRDQELPHEEAIRLTLARVLVAPAFLYRAEKPVPGKDAGAVSDLELASRLSYFLWSSTPDAQLLEAASSGKLHEPAVLAAQTKRMLSDPRMRRLSIEFGCSWLHIHGFDELSEKSERHFPTFNGLRGAMYEETIRFFSDLFQNDRPVLNLLDADYAFLNDALAKHYAIPGVSGAEFRQVNGIKKYARGGILAQSSFLAKESGASRTSPILRGNWVAEVLLGDTLPKPPKDVPPLPEDEATEKLTVRQLTEKHTTDPRCATCHKRIDAFGYSLEGFDAIGRKRDRDLGERIIDTRVKVLDGEQFEGLDGLRTYLLTKRKDAFLHQFCRKLLGYALCRAVQLSDEPLLKEMQAELKANDYRVGVVINKIVQSQQFRNIRGKDATDD